MLALIFSLKKKKAKPKYIVLTKVLDVIAPPYTSDFVQLFLPILENDSIAGTIRTEGEHDPVAEFIGTPTALAAPKLTKLPFCHLAFEK